MGRIRKRRCACCGIYFLPGPYHPGQSFCDAPECRAASVDESRRRHRRLKGLDPDFRRMERERVRKYRREKSLDPGYRESERERLRRYRRGGAGAGNEDAVPPPPVPDTAGPASGAACVRDLDNFYPACLLGLISFLSDGGDEGAAVMAGRLHGMGVQLLGNLNILDGNVMRVLSSVIGTGAAGSGGGVRT